ncbi:LemA family protein [Flavobacterium subsaxonicum]|uniref:LemA family protein n=1 Tax=Flavobacterium subsaxonicum WB 4.1-42 = DSM 21790 TaxID=1121898 RepID=A0A0A2MPM6_9FLAO|nr:LemA family protein [Flavobacterium subsaxonicum]KGO94269.1 LemA family protein [Flavobacterium subsaxonicum WB 4.1-42 = DSM 21790]
MKKWLIPVIIIVAIVAIVGFWAVGIKNGAIPKNQAVGKAWGNVETSYQRRNDLIGNLVKTVEGAANFEKGTLTAVTEARAKASSIQVDAANATPEQLEAFGKAQAGVQSTFGRLLATVENYPTLRANENFLKLQDELASTENTIQTARTRFNESVEEYNNYILKFPNSLFLGNYKEKPFFNSVEGADKPVDVNFNIK